MCVCVCVCVCVYVHDNGNNEIEGEEKLSIPPTTHLFSYSNIDIYSNIQSMYTYTKKRKEYRLENLWIGY